MNEETRVMLAQLTSALGAVAMLGSYVGLQVGALSSTSRSFNAINFLGAFLLGACAVLDERWGFIVLEGVWCAVSLAAFVKAKKKGETR